MKSVFALSILVLVLSACSTAKVRLLQGQKGVNTVVVRDIEMKDAEKAALSAAQNYCEMKKSSLIILKEKSFYAGPADPKIRYSMRSASRAVSLIPGRALIKGREYQAGVMFRCQNKIFQAAN